MPDTVEIWKPIPSLPGVEASSLGRIRVHAGEPTLGYWDKQHGRYVYHTPRINSDKTFRVSKVICEAFHGPAPVDKPICLHEAENSRNNQPDNLKWGTNKENQNYPLLKQYRQRQHEARKSAKRNGVDIPKRNRNARASIFETTGEPIEQPTVSCAQAE